MERAEVKKIVSEIVKEAAAIAKMAGRDLVGEIEQLVTFSMSESDIKQLARTVIAEEIDPSNIAKVDRQEVARAVIKGMHMGRSGGSDIRTLYGGPNAVRKSSSADSQDDVRKRDGEPRTAVDAVKQSMRNPRRMTRGTV
jgi:hypothetical protein